MLELRFALWYSHTRICYRSAGLPGPGLGPLTAGGTCTGLKRGVCEPLQLWGGRCGRGGSVAPGLGWCLRPPALQLCHCSAVEPPVQHSLLCVCSSASCLFTCPVVLETNLCRWRMPSIMCLTSQPWLGNLSTPVIGIAIPVIKAKPDHLAAIMGMSCSVTVGHSVQLPLWHVPYWEETTRWPWATSPRLAGRKSLWKCHLS